MASRNGLNPKIRGLKGVGFNRALPAAFGFDNGIKPDGVNGYLLVPALAGKLIDTPVTVEFWTKPSEDKVCSWCGFKVDYSPNNMRLNFDSRGLNTYGAVTTYDGWGFQNNGSLHHLVGYFDPVTSKMGQITDANSMGYITANAENLSLFLTNQLAYFVICSDVSFTEKSPHLMDEFRIYKKVLTLTEVEENYNKGMGRNPSITEDLMLWYNFEKFELLDFSFLQDGSDTRLGIRDLSGNNNHAQPINMNTDPESPTYVLKRF